MYFLFRFHHVMPSQFRDMSINEKTIVKSFMYRQLDDLKEENRGGE